MFESRGLFGIAKGLDFRSVRPGFGVLPCWYVKVCCPIDHDLLLLEVVAPTRTHSSDGDARPVLGPDFASGCLMVYVLSATRGASSWATGHRVDIFNRNST